MKRYSIDLPSIGRVSFSIPQIRKEKSFETRLLKTLIYTLYSGFFLFLVLLPLGKFVYPNLSSETSYFYAVLYFMLILIGLLVGVIALGGTKRLVDPHGLVAVLLFSLVTTSAAIAVNNPTIENTFGKGDIRGLGGLGIMIFLFLFYITSFLIRDDRSWRRASFALAAGQLIFVYTMLFTSLNFYSYLVAVVLLPFLVMMSHMRRFMRSIVYMIAITLLVIPFAYPEKLFTPSISGVRTYSILPEAILLTSFVSSFVIVLIYLYQKRDFVVRKLVEYISLFSSKSKISRAKKLNLIIPHSADFAIFTLPAILLGIFLYLWIDRGLVDDMFSNSFDELKSSWELLSLDTNQFKTMLVGYGGSVTAAGDSTIANILRSQGLLGVSAYLGIWIYGIQVGLKSFLRSLKSSTEYKILAANLFILLTLPLLGFFSYVSFFALTVWWISFTLVNIYSSIENNKNEELFIHDNFEVIELKVKNRTIVLRLFSILAMLILVGVVALIVLLHGEIN